MCVFTLLVHAVGTSHAHRRERRAHRHTPRCEQCRAPVSDPVAAHVVAYACAPCNPCLGQLTLCTTCRVCNAANQRRDSRQPCLPRRARIWRAPWWRGVALGRVRRCWCWRHDAASPASRKTTKTKNHENKEQLR